MPVFRGSPRHAASGAATNGAATNGAATDGAGAGIP
jgi:hypothetical protein